MSGARMGLLFGLKDTGAVSVAHGRLAMQGLATSPTTMVSSLAGPSSPWLSVGLLVSLGYSNAAARIPRMRAAAFDEDEVAPPKPRQPVAPPKPRRKKEEVDVNDFLRRSEPPARYYSPDRETPARIAAMPEPDQYFFKEWLVEVRKKRAQVPAPP